MSIKTKNKCFLFQDHNFSNKNNLRIIHYKKKSDHTKSKFMISINDK